MKKLLLIFVIIICIALTIFIAINHHWLKENKLPTLSQDNQLFSKNRKNITFYHYWDKDFEKLKQALAFQEQQYNSRGKSPILKIKSLTHEAYKKNMNAMMEDGTHPELFSYWAGARTQTLVNANELAPVSTIWKIAGLDSVFSPFACNTAASYNNQKYLIPLTQCYIGFFYNKHIFKKLGLTPPKNWAELLAVCNQIRHSGKIPFALGTKYHWPAQFWFDYILLRTAGYSYRQKLMIGEVNYSDSQVLTVFEHWKKLLDKGYFNPSPSGKDWTESVKMVFNGEAAMVLMGTWAIDSFTKWGWKENIDFGFFPFPAMDKKIPMAMTTVIDGIVLSRSDANQNLADQALIFFTKPEVQEAVSRASGNFSPSTRIPISFYSPLKQKILKSVPKELAFPYDLDTLPAVEKIGLQLFSNFIKTPAAYKQLLTNADKQIRPLFSKPE
jgi:multiple sugar transport system substrate-binding protein/raffinose/stachyose/melibiose transport system substrate-binding protein